MRYRGGRKGFRHMLGWLWMALIPVIAATGLPAATGVLPHTLAGVAHADEVTISYDNLRTDWDAHEPALSPAAVGGGGFGPLFATRVNGQVYAQPLVVGPTVIVATENDRVYGLNAVTGAVKWSVSVGAPWGAPPSCQLAVAPNFGITSTPVYDPATGSVYVVARIVPRGGTAANPVTEMVGINAQTGTVTERVPIGGAAVNDPGRQFNSYSQLQRTGLLLMNGWVYAAFASFCDLPPYEGYVAGINVHTKALTLWSDEAGAGDSTGGIWQSGGGLMSDGPGRIFFTSGNGTAPMPGPGRFSLASRPQAALGQSVVRLGVRVDGSLQAMDFFSPANAAALNAVDDDFGSGAPVGLPFGTSHFPHLLVQAGKDGRLFLLNRDNLGGMAQGPGGMDAAISVAGPFGSLYGHPAIFADATTASLAFPGDDYIYYLGTYDHLRALRFLVNRAGVPHLADAGDSLGIFGPGSGSPVVTSAGPNFSSAVVWVISEVNAVGAGGALEAFDAIPRTPCSATVPTACLRMIWSYPVGTASKYTTPATDGGRVYVGTRDGVVFGFGVRNSPSPMTFQMRGGGLPGAGCHRSPRPRPCASCCGPARFPYLP